MKLRNKLLNFSQYHLLPWLEQRTQKWRTKTFTDIGKKWYPDNKKHALVINISTAIPYYLEGDIYNCPILNNHALYWEVAELVKQLNELGYLVDFIDCNDPNPTIQWEKYEVVFDERNNLVNAPSIPGQTKVFYSTGLLWSFQNEQELLRCDDFYKRTGLRVMPRRMAQPTYNDEFAQFQTYYGRDEFMNQFSHHSKKIPLQVSVPFSTNDTSQIKKDPTKFVWFAGAGAIHKGLDLTVEAFSQLPHLQLSIYGPAQREPDFFKWLKQMTEAHKNIIYKGYGDLTSSDVINDLLATTGNIFPSCSEGGQGSVAQTSIYGIIPIVTPTANVKHGESLHITLTQSSPTKLIEEIKEKVVELSQWPASRIEETAKEIKAFANKNHSRQAYTQSLSKALNRILPSS